MKVICIDGVKAGDPSIKWLVSGLPAKKQDEIYEGEIYNVVGESEVRGQEGYRLQERPYNNLYRKERFAPCSEFSEIEMVREYKKELV